MDNSCEIPQGKEISSGQVNDDLPTVEALKVADGIEVLDGKGEKHTFKSIYSGPELSRRVLVVFVRHFFCCVSSLRMEETQLTPSVMCELHQLSCQKRNSRKAKGDQHRDCDNRSRRS